ncbi:MAG TPA: xylulokinase [bacterium (Candidatus Stahlbacteria)]|nr:xylulokinase [Candidatus Stahlbacteria bacterium]
MAYLIGIDIGTTGVKTLMIDEVGSIIANSFVSYPTYTPKPNWVEQYPQNWYDATIKTLSEVVMKSRVHPQDIKGIGFSGQMHGLVLLDKDDKVLRPAILWCDTRTAKEAQWITQTVGNEKLKEWVSNAAFEGFTAPKIVWIRENEPQVYSRINKILLPKDYVRFRLSGECTTEVSDASGTLLFDVKRRQWAHNILEAIGIPGSFLPNCYESIDICGYVSEEAAKLTGINEGTPVVSGGSDNACGAVGVSIVKNGRVMASIGTSGVVLTHTETPIVDPKMRLHTFCHSVPNKWYLMGVMLSAGGALRWFKDILGVNSYELLEKEAKSATAGSDGLIFLPYLMGERTPHKNANAKGVFFGLTIRHRRAHLVRSIMEGVAYGMRDSLEIMKGLGVQINQIRITGGGAKSTFWAQIQADVYGTEVVTVNIYEGAAFGAALLAGVGTGIFESIEQATDNIVCVTAHVEPIPKNVAMYNEYYEIYKSLYPKLKENFGEISGKLIYL